MRFRHDWRFLLPAAVRRAPTLLLGGDARAADALRESRFVGDVATSPASVDPDDPPRLLVGLAGPDGDGLAALEPFLSGETDASRPALGDDPTVVIEVSRQAAADRWRSDRAVKQLADTLGLDVADRYLVAPGHHASRWYAPVGSGAPLRWYLESSFIPGDAATTAAAAVGRGAAASGTTAMLRWLAADMLVILRPARRTARRKSPGGTADDGLLVLPDAVPGTRVVLLGSSQDEASRAVLAPFLPGAKRPATVVKIAAMPAVNERTIGEHQRLQRLRASLSDAGPHGSFPAPFDRGQIGALAWTEQQAATGETAERRLGARGTSDAEAAEVLDLVVDWAVAHQRAGRLDPVDWTDSRLAGQLVGPVVAGADLDPRHRLRDVADTLLHLGASGGRRPLPMAHGHFDLAPCNVTLDGSGPLVIDWELPQATYDLPGADLYAAPAGADLAFFVAYWAFQRLGAETVDDEVDIVEALVAPLHGRGTTAGERVHGETAPGGDDGETGSGDRDDGERGHGDVVATGRAALARYGAAVGLDPGLWPVVWALLWWQRYRARQARVGQLRRAGLGLDRPDTERELDAAARFLDVAARALVT